MVLSIVIGTLLAFHYQSGRSRGREIMQFIIFLPFLMPPIITGLSLLIYFREIDFERSLVTVIIGHTVFVLALVYRTILVRLQSLSRSTGRGLLRSRRQRLADLPPSSCCPISPAP